MKTMAVGDLKSHFSAVLEEVKRGHPVAIGYGKRKTKVAVIIPFGQYGKAVPRRLGVMENRATYAVRGDFKISDEDLVPS